MADHTRRTVLRGTAVAAAGGLVGATGGRVAAAPVPGTATQGGRRFPFLEGAFKPVTEELTAFDLPVTGRVHLPGRVPLGFHGSWIPDA
ncbi:hypothetical protein ACFTY8_03550 [Streptomyces mirabilis]|uniref:hypothetical protein n=1 Tax=Streptomyces mirabilis TaxID=68239 RepID=UPI00363FC8AE